MFGPRLALIAMTLVMLGAAASGSFAVPSSLPLNIVLIWARCPWP